MQVLAWDEGQLRSLQEYADQHPLTVQDVLSGKVPPAGDSPEYVRILGGGRLVYCIELGQPIGPCRHLSLSLPGGGLPDPVAVIELGKELGFRPFLEDGMVWTETLPNGLEAINWLQMRDQA